MFPILGRIASAQRISAATVTWALTSAFIASAVSTPIIGRLSDLYGHRNVLLGTLVVVLVGSIISAVTTDFPVFVVARVLSGPASALYALSSSTLQHHLPKLQMNRAIGLMSSLLGVGGGFALVVAGLLGGDHYRVIFWFPAAFTALALVTVLLGVPGSADRQRGTVDVVGGLLLSAGLVLVLLPLSQAARWGLGSARSLGCLGAAAIVFSLFVLVERRVDYPMLPLPLLHRRMVVATAISILVGAMSFVPLVILPILLEQDPPIVGQRSATPLVIALVYLGPGVILGLFGTPLGSRLIQHFGSRAAVSAVGVTGMVGAALACALPITPWALITGSVLTSVALYIYYGALPLQIVPIVDRPDLGVANSLVSLGRWVGAALATASTSLVLSSDGSVGSLTEGAFRAAFAIGVVVSAAVCLVAAVFLRGPRDAAVVVQSVDGPGAVLGIVPPVGDLTTEIIATQVVATDGAATDGAATDSFAATPGFRRLERAVVDSATAMEGDGIG